MLTEYGQLSNHSGFELESTHFVRRFYNKWSQMVFNPSFNRKINKILAVVLLNDSLLTSFMFSFCFIRTSCTQSEGRSMNKN